MILHGILRQVRREAIGAETHKQWQSHTPQPVEATHPSQRRPSRYTEDLVRHALVALKPEVGDALTLSLFQGQGQ